MGFIALPEEKLSSILSKEPLPTQYPWLKAYLCDASEFFRNTSYSDKIVAASIMASGSIVVGRAIPLYSLDTVRLKDNGVFSTNRHFIIASDEKTLVQTEIHKDFPEHHLSEIPQYYKVEKPKGKITKWLKRIKENLLG